MKTCCRSTNTTCKPTTWNSHSLLQLVLTHIHIPIVLQHIVLVFLCLFIVSLVPFVLPCSYCNYLPLFVSTIYSPCIRYSYLSHNIKYTQVLSVSSSACIQFSRFQLGQNWIQELEETDNTWVYLILLLKWWQDKPLWYGQNLCLYRVSAHSQLL